MLIRRHLFKPIPTPVKNIVRPLLMPLFRWSENRNKHRLYSSLLSPGDLVFDVGSHMGESAEVFVASGARVVCVEPNPSCLEILQQRFGDNQDVIVVGKGVSDRDGTLDFFVCDDDSPVSTFDDRWKTGRFAERKWDRTLSVPVTTLDALVEEFGLPEYCKIDVEGFELKVLAGLHHKIRHVSFEFTREFLADAKACADYMPSLGRPKFNFTLYSYYKLCSKTWLDSEPLFDLLESMDDEQLTGDIFVELR